MPRDKPTIIWESLITVENAYSPTSWRVSQRLPSSSTTTSSGLATCGYQEAANRSPDVCYSGTELNIFTVFLNRKFIVFSLLQLSAPLIKRFMCSLCTYLSLYVYFWAKLVKPIFSFFFFSWLQVGLLRKLWTDLHKQNYQRFSGWWPVLTRHLTIQVQVHFYTFSNKSRFRKI